MRICFKNRNGVECGLTICFTCKESNVIQGGIKWYGRPTLAMIDAQSAKTGPNARGDTGFDGDKNVKGRKRHTTVDILGLVLKADIHFAGVQDSDGTAFVLDSIPQRFPIIEKSWLMALRPGRSRRATARGPLKSSNAPIQKKALSSCQNAGLSNEHSHGSALTGDF